MMRLTLHPGEPVDRQHPHRQGSSEPGRSPVDAGSPARGCPQLRGMWGAGVGPGSRRCRVTCDVDPHFATIGGSPEAIAATMALPVVDVVIDDREVEPRYYS